MVKYNYHILKALVRTTTTNNVSTHDYTWDPFNTKYTQKFQHNDYQVDPLNTHSLYKSSTTTHFPHIKYVLLYIKTMVRNTYLKTDFIVCTPHHEQLEPLRTKVENGEWVGFGFVIGIGVVQWSRVSDCSWEVEDKRWKMREESTVKWINLGLSILFSIFNFQFGDFNFIFKLNWEYINSGKYSFLNVYIVLTCTFNRELTC